MIFYSKAAKATKREFLSQIFAALLRNLSSSLRSCVGFPVFGYGYAALWLFRAVIF